VVRIAEAVLVSEFIALAIIVFTQDLYDFDRSFFVIDALICTAAIAASRLAERVARGSAARRSTGRHGER